MVGVGIGWAGLSVSEPLVYSSYHSEIINLYQSVSICVYIVPTRYLPSYSDRACPVSGSFL